MLISEKKTWFIFFVQKQTNCHLTSSIHCFSQWGSRHLLYHFHSLCTYWEPRYFFPGKLVPRGFWERETNAVQWKPWSSTANGVCGHDYVKMDHFIGATLGKVSFLVLWHIWTNLAANIAVNRWNVDHVWRCVRPRWPQRFLQVSLGTGHYLCTGADIEEGSRLFRIV